VLHAMLFRMLSMFCTFTVVHYYRHHHHNTLFFLEGLFIIRSCSLSHFLQKS